MNALTAPTSGSPGYMAARQMTPAAKSEIAIGMKTTVLKATDQLTRSVMTAKRSPIAVTRAGTTPTQIALFLIAVTVFRVVEELLVVLEPDEPVELATLVVEEAPDDRPDRREDHPEPEEEDRGREANATR